MNKKILILDTTGSDWTDRHIALHNEVEVDSIYTPHSLFLRGLRRYHLYSNMCRKSIWYGSWFKKLDNYRLIIIFSDIKSVSIFKDIRNQGYQGKLCFYYRDPVARKRYRPGDIHALDADVFLSSFDSDDAEKYNMFLNPQFFFREDKIKAMDIIYDAVLVSSDRGRLPLILSVKNLLDKEDLKSYFFVLKDKGKKYSKSSSQAGVSFQDKPLDYEDILMLNQQSRAIVEINAKGQAGLTNRAMESLFMGKKLITNNMAIQELDFYHPDNVYILDSDSRSIREFLMVPYNFDVQEKRNYYEFNAWLCRMQQAMQVYR